MGRLGSQKLVDVWERLLGIGGVEVKRGKLMSLRRHWVVSSYLLLYPAGTTLIAGIQSLVSETGVEEGKV